MTEDLLKSQLVRSDSSPAVLLVSMASGAASLHAGSGTLSLNWSDPVPQAQPEDGSPTPGLDSSRPPQAWRRSTRPSTLLPEEIRLILPPLEF